MPSHITHLVFAEDMVTRCFGTDHPFLREHGSIFALGAQGPDIFYHNQRTMPTAIYYGVLLHRHGYGKFCAHLVDFAMREHLDFHSAEGAFIAAYITHAVLDRYTHPFINYFSGWPDPEDKSTERFRSMHPFFERIIDLFVLSRFRGITVNDYDFAGRVSCGDDAPRLVSRIQRLALSESYRRARNDESLAERLRNAYSDAMGYYRYSNTITPDRLAEGLRREKLGDIGPRWLAILHPISLLPDIDYLNEAGSVWFEPCEEGERTSASFWDLYREAGTECSAALSQLERAWSGNLELFGQSDSLESAIGNGGLSDRSGRTSPCTKSRSSPLPLSELLTHLRRRIVEDDLPDAPPVLPRNG